MGSVVGKREGGGGIITASNIIGNGIPSYYPSYHLGISIVRKSILYISTSSSEVKIRFNVSFFLRKLIITNPYLASKFLHIYIIDHL